MQLSGQDVRTTTGNFFKWTEISLVAIATGDSSIG